MLQAGARQGNEGSSMGLFKHGVYPKMASLLGNMKKHPKFDFMTF